MRSLVVSAPKVDAATKTSSKQAKNAGAAKLSATVTTLKVALSAAIALDNYQMTTESPTAAQTTLNRDLKTLQALKPSSSVVAAQHAVTLAKTALKKKSVMPAALRSLETLGAGIKKHSALEGGNKS